MMDIVAKTYREMLISTIEKYPFDTPLTLSGGVDTSTILAALLLLGRKPTCYHFMVENQVSKDYIFAKKIAKDFGLNLVILEFPRDYDTLVSDTKMILSIIQSTHPTAVQCAHPYPRLIEQVRKDGYNSIIRGIPGFPEESKTTVLLRAYGRFEEANSWWKRMADAPGQGYYGILGEYVVLDYFQFESLQPYRDKNIVEYGLTLSVKEDIDVPVEKGVALRAFPEFYSKGDYWKPLASSQVESGFTEWHKDLLNSPLNTKNSKKVVGIYNSMLRSMYNDEVISSGGGTLSTRNSPFYKILKEYPHPWPRLPVKKKDSLNARA